MAGRADQIDDHIVERSRQVGRDGQKVGLERIQHKLLDLFHLWERFVEGVYGVEGVGEWLFVVKVFVYPKLTGAQNLRIWCLLLGCLEGHFGPAVHLGQPGNFRESLGSSELARDTIQEVQPRETLQCKFQTQSEAHLYAGVLVNNRSNLVQNSRIWFAHFGDQCVLQGISIVKW